MEYYSYKYVRLPVRHHEGECRSHKNITEGDNRHGNDGGYWDGEGWVAGLLAGRRDRVKPNKGVETGRCPL